jgi:hypothetical protein
LGPLLVLGCFGFWFWAPLYTICVPRGIDGLGFLCMLEALCVILVYLEALYAFFFLYIYTDLSKRYSAEIYLPNNRCFEASPRTREELLGEAFGGTRGNNRYIHIVFCGAFGGSETIDVSRTHRGLERSSSISFLLPSFLGLQAGSPRGLLAL